MIFWIIFIAILIGASTGYREVQALIERHSWKWEDYWKRLYWFTDQAGNDKDKDSWHVSNGFTFALISLLEALVLFFALNLCWYWILILTAAFWIGQFWIRNIWMHIVSKKQPLWHYLMPLNLLKFWRKN